MSKYLKGNFKTKHMVEDKHLPSPTLEDRFEIEALKNLGGSIAFVAKKKILWGDDDVDDNSSDN